MLALVLCALVVAVEGQQNVLRANNLVSRDTSKCWEATQMRLCGVSVFVLCDVMLWWFALIFARVSFYLNSLFISRSLLTLYLSVCRISQADSAENGYHGSGCPFRL